MASYDNKPLDGNGLSHLWLKIKSLFALKTELPAAGSTTPVMDGTGATGTSTAYARADHVHPTDTSRAPLASPALTGAPTAPTAAAGTNTTQIATTAFVKAATDALDTGVTGVKGNSESTYRTGQVNITAANIGLGNVDNTADANKSVASAATLTTARTIDGVEFDGSKLIHHSLSGISSSSTSTKTVITASLSGFVRAQGARFTIVLGTSLTIDDKPLYFNINNTGEWAANRQVGTQLTGGKLTVGRAYEFIATSSSYMLVGELDTNTTYSAATTSADGLMSASDKTKLNGIAEGAQVNQNAFGNVKVGSTTIAADTATDTLTLTAGSNVTLTPDASGDSVTIAATDTNTTYTLTQDATDGHKITLTPSSGSATTITIPDNDTKALGSMTGTLGVGHGGTGVSTLGAGVVYHSASGTGALSIATAANLVSAIGNTAVNRATADASGNNIASTYLTQTSAASTYATKSEIVGLYKYKGSVATESDLPASPSTGDVYNIEAASTYGAAGANVAWNGTSWDSLGEIFQLDPLTNAEIDAICV